MKKSIEISPNIETLFGTRDENLHVLEDGLNINIALRSNSIDLEGAARDVAITTASRGGVIPPPILRGCQTDCPWPYRSSAVVR